MWQSLVLVLLGLWAGWVLLHLSLMVAISTFMKPDFACFTGLVIVIPDWLSDQLDEGELDAVIAHEEAHRQLCHVWRNFALNSVFIRPSAESVQRDELQADQWAADRGHGPDLWRALVKLSGGILHDDNLRERLAALERHHLHT